jgi:hypothetical protein
MFDDLIFDNKPKKMAGREEEYNTLKKQEEYSATTGPTGHVDNSGIDKSVNKYKKIKKKDDDQANIPFWMNCLTGWKIRKQKGMWILHREC